MQCLVIIVTKYEGKNDLNNDTKFCKNWVNGLKDVGFPQKSKLREIMWDYVELCDPCPPGNVVEGYPENLNLNPDLHRKGLPSPLRCPGNMSVPAPSHRPEMTADPSEK